MGDGSKVRRQRLVVAGAAVVAMMLGLAARRGGAWLFLPGSGPYRFASPAEEAEARVAHREVFPDQVRAGALAAEVVWPGVVTGFEISREGEGLGCASI